MTESTVVIKESSRLSDICIPREEENVSTLGPIEIGSPLTPIAHLPLSTPKESTSRKYIGHQNDDGDDTNKVIDDLGSDSDSNSPPLLTIEDLFHVESKAGLETSVDTNTNSDDCQVVIIHLDEVMKMKVDQLRKELRLRGLSHRGLEAELIEHLHKDCEDKTPLINVSRTSIGPSGFDEKAKWKLLLGHEKAKMPQSLDHYWLSPVWQETRGQEIMLVIATYI